MSALRTGARRDITASLGLLLGVGGGCGHERWTRRQEEGQRDAEGLGLQERPLPWIPFPPCAFA